MHTTTTSDTSPTPTQPEAPPAIVRDWTHPDPATFANYLAIVGIDRGIFSQVTTDPANQTARVDFGSETPPRLRVDITAGPLMDTYRL